MSETSETKEERDEIAKAAIEAAVWVTCSPHEWVWTQEQQVAMAKYCVRAACVIGEAISDLEKIVCTKHPDDGVVLLSNEGPTHYDAEVGGQVYDHKHFSPLGDALIYLHQHLSSASNGKAALAPPACGVLTEDDCELLERLRDVAAGNAAYWDQHSDAHKQAVADSAALINLLTRARSGDTVAVRREDLEDWRQWMVNAVREGVQIEGFDPTKHVCVVAVDKYLRGNNG